MLENHFGKVITIILILIVSLFAFMFYSSNQKHQDYLEQEVQTLKHQVAEQNSTIETNKKLQQEESQRLAQLQVDKQREIEKQLLEKQQQLNQLKEQKLDDKLEKIESVVSDLDQQQQQQKELRDQQLKMSNEALIASYLVQGLQTASMLKMHIAEFYMTEDQFPSSNEQLGLPRANSYATDAIRSIWISKGGKITIVYKAITGRDNGAINLIPKLKNDQIQWECVSRDYKNIQHLMPQCKYSLEQ